MKSAGPKDGVFKQAELETWLRASTKLERYVIQKKMNHKETVDAKEVLKW